jgi:hypothetical protein
MADIDEERLNLSVRKFLKVVGVTSQREIETAARAAAEAGRLRSGAVKARVTLDVPELEIHHVIEDELNLS